MRKVVMSNKYSPRQASGQRAGKKISITLRIQAAVGHGEIKFTANDYSLDGNDTYCLEYIVLLLLHLLATFR